MVFILGLFHLLGSRYPLFMGFSIRLCCFVGILVYFVLSVYRMIILGNALLFL